MTIKTSLNIGGARAEPIGEVGEMGHPASTGEDQQLVYNDLPKGVLPLAQVMRDITIVDTSDAAAMQAMGQGLSVIPVIQPVTTEKFYVQFELDVTATDLVDSENFYLEAEARDSRNLPHAKRAKKINHGAAVKKYYTIAIPPKLTVVRGQGLTFVEVTQQDRSAGYVDLFMRFVGVDGGTPYSFLSRIDISKGDSARRYPVEVPLAGAAIIRGVPGLGERYGGVFSDVVVRPFTTPNSKSSQDLVMGIIRHSFNKDGIYVNAVTVEGRATHACIVRKGITSNDKVFKKISPYEPVYNSTIKVECQDDSALFDHVYEYRISFLLPDGRACLSRDSTIAKRTQTFTAPAIRMTGLSTTAANSAGNFGAKFTLSTGQSKPSPDDIVSATLQRLGIRDEYMQELSATKDIRKKLYMFHVTRKNLTTGHQVDMGIHPPGVFIDGDTKRQTTPPLYVGFSYEYKVELLCKDPAQILEELMNSKSFRESKAFEQSPLMGRAMTAQKAKFNPNNEAKFFSHQAIVGSTISTGDALVKNHAGGSLGMKPTGNFKEITVAFPQRLEAEVIEASASADEFGDVTLTWKTKGISSVDHFIIRAARPGYAFPCGVSHHASQAGTFKYVDKTQKNIPGNITYTIIPVMLNFTKGKPVKAGSVIVVGR